MTEKQYKGIAGNFLICDVQKEYAEHLLSILVKRFGMRFQFHFFSNVKKIEQFAEKAEIEILLIAEDCVSEIRGNVKAKKKFILSESMKNKRNFINKNIAEHTTCGPSDTTHDYSYPKRISESNTFTYPHYCK